MIITVAGYGWSITENCDFTIQVLKNFKWVACLFKTKRNEVVYNHSAIIEELQRINAKEYLSYTTLSFKKDINQLDNFINEYNKNNKTEYSINDLKVREH